MLTKSSFLYLDYKIDNMKLIKIKPDHYVIVDDSEIKEDDFVYVNCTELEVKDIRKVEDYYNEQFLFENGGQIHIDYCKKITHSTRPFGGSAKAISLHEVKELIGETEKWVYHNMTLEQMEYSGYTDFVKGYRQALEDNKEKKYTEEDMINAFIKGTNAGALHERLSDYDNGNFEEAEQYSEQYEESFIQSLQPKTEWGVEFDENGKLRLK